MVGSDCESHLHEDEPAQVEQEAYEEHELTPGHADGLVYNALLLEMQDKYEVLWHSPVAEVVGSGGWHQLQENCAEHVEHELQMLHCAAAAPTAAITHSARRSDAPYQ